LPVAPLRIATTAGAAKPMSRSDDWVVGQVDANEIEVFK
jgi:hypothetical protein